MTHNLSSSCCIFIIISWIFISLMPRHNGCHFADHGFKCFFLNVWISIKISPKFVPKCLINNILALVQIMAWHRPGDKPLSEPKMVGLTHTFVTRPHWVKELGRIGPIQLTSARFWPAPRTVKFCIFIGFIMYRCVTLITAWFVFCLVNDHNNQSVMWDGLLLFAPVEQMGSWCDFAVSAADMLVPSVLITAWGRVGVILWTLWSKTHDYKLWHGGNIVLFDEDYFFLLNLRYCQTKKCTLCMTESKNSYELLSLTTAITLVTKHFVCWNPC